jgi:hypothetical protein
LPFLDPSKSIFFLASFNTLKLFGVNQIMQIRSTKTGEKIIGLISKIMRKAVAEKIDVSNEPDIVENVIKVNLVGLHRTLQK